MGHAVVYRSAAALGRYFVTVKSLIEPKRTNITRTFSTARHLFLPPPPSAVETVAEATKTDSSPPPLHPSVLSPQARLRRASILQSTNSTPSASNSMRPTRFLDNFRSGYKPVVPDNLKSSIPDEELNIDLLTQPLEGNDEFIPYDLNKHINQTAPEPYTPRLVASVGRTVHVIKGRFDFARALGRLDMMCRQNRLSLDVLRQKFHERPGLKRKRLKRERWRRNFMSGFRATCKRVDELRKQGW